MSDFKSIPPAIFKATNAHEGFKEIFSPKSGATQYLSYARLVFGPTIRSHTLKGDDREWSLFAVKGPVTARVKGKTYELNQHDILYVPRRTGAELSGKAGGDIALGG